MRRIKFLQNLPPLPPWLLLTVRRLSRRAHPLVLLGLALATLGGIYELRGWMDRHAERLARELLVLKERQRELDTALGNVISLRDLKLQDFATFKDDFSNVAVSKKGLYESGLQVQEEKRLLEKQWDILITHLKLEPESQRIQIVRGDQAVESHSIYFGIPQSYGKVRPLPEVVKITSKERFAHPERGKAEKVNDVLVWTPPQVGTSVRSNALGEYVMFTDSDLVLHGPPLKLDEHEAFAHICLGLPKTTAKNLYQRSFVGTKFVLDWK